jgi:RNA-binding protein
MTPAAPAMTALSERQRRHLRGLAHALDPVIMIGQAGVTPGVITETARALHDHELIKVKARGAGREARDAILAELARSTASVLVQRIGHVGVLYKAHTALPRIILPGP